MTGCLLAQGSRFPCYRPGPDGFRPVTASLTGLPVPSPVVPLPVSGSDAGGVSAIFLLHSNMPMDMPTNRRLASILAADMVGYSALMAQDEQGTLVRRTEIRNIIEAVSADGSGRLFGQAGDGFLSEFASPVEAVRAAHKIQTELAFRRQTDESYPKLRIGVHLADIVPEGDDLLGDGVNVAARIEGVAEPGSVTVSQQIFDQVKRTARLNFQDLGDWSLKNIPEPVRLYRVVGEQSLHSYASTQSASAMPQGKIRRDKPSVVVLPFANLSGDPDQNYFVDGFSEDLITELARFKALFVIARNVTFALRGKQVDEAVAGREVGASHSVAGSLRKQGGRVRIAVQLVRTTTGETIWAERFDSSMEELFDIQDRIAARIAAAVVGRVEADATQAARRKRPADLVAYDCLLHGLDHHRLGGVTSEDARQAVQWFDKAIELDANYGRAHAWRACAISSLAEWTGDAWLDESLKSARLALSLDPDEAEVHRILGSINIMSGGLEKALQHFRRGLEINPSHAYLVAKTAEIYNCLGQPSTALELATRAREIDPYIPENAWEEEVISYYLLERYPEAIALASHFELPTRRALIYATASSCHCEAADNTARLASALRKMDPQFRISTFVPGVRFKSDAVKERLAADLRSAGLPD
jgi:adenylate cyclase